MVVWESWEGNRDGGFKKPADSFTETQLDPNNTVSNKFPEFKVLFITVRSHVHFKVLRIVCGKAS